MNAFFQYLKPFIRAVVKRAWLVLLIAFTLSAFCLYLAQHLRIDTDLSQLVPSHYPSVQALETLRATVGGESDLAVGIESPSFEANKTFAEALIPEVLALKGDGYDEPFFSRVDYYRDIRFIEENALYFASDDELDKLQTYLEDKIEESRLEANPFYFDLGDDEDEESIEDTADELIEAYDEIVGKEYPISEDSTIMALRFFPTGSRTNIGFIEDAYAAVEQLVVDMAPEKYHPDMKVTVAGRLFRQLSEIRSVTNDVARSFGAGVSMVLLLVTLYFFYKMYQVRKGPHFSMKVLLRELPRFPALALVIALPLLMSLTWTFALAYLAIGTLNLMTSTLGLVLFGLGVDFGIHFYARYTEERGQGKGLTEAAETTFTSTGQATTVGALTTAAALFVLMLADFRGFSEFGFIAGTGILFALFAMLVVLPALLAVLERTHLLYLESGTPPSRPSKRTHFLPGGKWFVVGSLTAVLFALVFVPRVSFEYDSGKLAPTYEDYNRRQEVVGKVFGSTAGRRNPAYIVVDHPDEVPPIIEAVKRYAEADTVSPTIGIVESLHERFPMNPEEQQVKLERIATIRELLDDPFISTQDSEELDMARCASSTTQPLELDDVPEYLRKRFTSKNGDVGNFVIVYPSISLSDGRQSIAFSDDVGEVVTADGTVYHAGSTSLVGADMLRLMMAEAPWMVAATFLIVAALMWINFGTIRWAALALLPLVIGVLWMMLLMEVFDLKLNFYNIVVLPAVLGIGNDDGVHLIHRYRERGFGSIFQVWRSTGEHVAMTTITTMIGFSGLLLSFHPGLRSIGELAVVGIGATLLAALIFLPSLLQVLEKIGWLSPEIVPGEGHS